MPLLLTLRFSAAIVARVASASRGKGEGLLCWLSFFFLGWSVNDVPRC